MREWSRAGHQAEDARCQWELKWGATREYLKHKQKEDRCKETELQEKLLEMQPRLCGMAANRAHTASADWTKLVSEVREMENTQAAKWRKFSRLRWIREGDAPSRFFFSILKARQELYRQHPVSEEDEELRQRILNLVHKRLSVAHNTHLIEKPDEEEIGKEILHLKSEKSPGIDGMTAKVLQLLWRHAPGDVVGFIHKVWDTGKLAWKHQTGVIKLIPKEGDRQRIKNWRPLTLLNAGYKLVSKLMANRLWLVLPEIVDTQQKGFIQGRNITDSVLNFLLCQEWAEKSQQEMLFIKLDFEKAYDRVNHKYLWQVMETTGFDPKFIQLTKGLVEGSTSKLHVNGRFSQEILIERGVKQGCPLVPLLFSLSTEPLMSLLKKQECDGNLEGLYLARSRTALYNFFADYSGVFLKASQMNFRSLQQTISMYEKISGAKLNLEKSTVIPVGMASTPQWLRAMGCYIAREGEPIWYLGYPIGWRGDTQKLWQILRMVHHPGEDWMLALGALLSWTVTKGQWMASMRHWETEEILMASCPGSILGAKTATGWLKVWARARTRLEIPRSEFTPQGESSVEVVITIGEQQGWFMTVEAKAIKATLRRHKIKTIGQWTDWASWNDARRPLPQLEQTAVEVGLEFFPRNTPVQFLPWNWKSKKRRGEWFTVTTKECRTLKIGHGDGVCARCRIAIEMPEHMWWQCKDTADRWRDFRYLTEALSCHIPRADCFIDTDDAAFRGQDPGKIVPFILLTRATWLDRNQVTYTQQRSHSPVGITLRFGVEVANSLRWKLDPTTKAAKKLEIAEKMLQMAASRAGGSENRTETTTQGGEAGDVEARGGERQEPPSQASSHGEEEEDT
ncbi:hypothetical protein R1flu_010937 [Riccia fluitans]|uniref:Reverse transcriptase domain-containing protein n=1 Tax=Riccia fluitans TaxID=41844 RepID=A0ABD1Z6E8_9MARC